MPPRCFFYGTGNIGLGLALALQARGWQVGAWNRGAARAQAASRALQLPVSHAATPPPANADLLWITVTDDAIAAVSQAVLAQPLPPQAVLLHTSGCLPAEALGPGPTPRGSLHPLLACPTPERARDGLPGAFFALQGDAAALRALDAVVQALQGRHAVLSAAGKARYHAAAVMASNLVVALLDLAGHEAQAAGLHDLTALSEFARGAVDNALSLGTVRGLTGPALRGDARTLQAHVQALGPNALPIYRLLSQHAVGMAQTRGLSASAADAVRQVLEMP